MIFYFVTDVFGLSTVDFGVTIVEGRCTPAANLIASRADTSLESSTVARKHHSISCTPLDSRIVSRLIGVSAPYCGPRYRTSRAYPLLQGRHFRIFANVVVNFILGSFWYLAQLKCLRIIPFCIPRGILIYQWVFIGTFSGLFGFYHIFCSLVH